MIRKDDVYIVADITKILIECLINRGYTKQAIAKHSGTSLKVIKRILTNRPIRLIDYARVGCYVIIANNMEDN